MIETTTSLETPNPYHGDYRPGDDGLRLERSETEPEKDPGNTDPEFPQPGEDGTGDPAGRESAEGEPRPS